MITFTKHSPAVVNCATTRICIITKINKKTRNSSCGTQEAHYPPHNKCSLCWSVSWWGGGPGVTPSSPGWEGPHPADEGVLLSSLNGWVPQGIPILILDGVSLLSAGWGIPHTDVGWGTPSPISRIGYPRPDLGWGTPLPVSHMGHPLPVDWWTDKLKTVPSSFLRMRAVTTDVKEVCGQNHSRCQIKLTTGSREEVDAANSNRLVCADITLCHYFALQCTHL